MSNKVCFVISHKYYRGYESYLKHYISNIQTFYPDALTIIVDNNSKYPEDVFADLRGLDKIVILTNDIESKFEMGAYTIGLKHIIENNLTQDYSYYIFTQDNFVLKNRYDFDKLIKSETYALPINSMHADGHAMDVCIDVLNKIGLNDNWDKINFCWCNSFIIASKKIQQLYGYLKTIVQKRRHESEASERYLARILWELNERRHCGSIDGNCIELPSKHYDCWRVNIYDNATTYFVKRVQQKNEHTVDKQ